MALSKQFLKTRPVCKVRFTLSPKEIGDAGEICVVGEFNDWSHSANPLKRLKDGSFSGMVEIPAGKEYRFRYLVDRQHWINEAQADGYEYCPFAGTDNSLLNI